METDTEYDELDNLNISLNDKVSFYEELFYEKLFDKIEWKKCIKVLNPILIFLLLSSSLYGQNLRVISTSNYPTRYVVPNYYQTDEYDRQMKSAETYYKLRAMYNEHKNTPTPPTKEQLERWNNSRLPYKLKESDFSNGVINWPEFFLVDDLTEVLTIDRAMAGNMGFFDTLAVRASVPSLEAKLYQYRHLLTGNEKIRYRQFLEGLRAHSFYTEEK